MLGAVAARLLKGRGFAKLGPQIQQVFIQILGGSEQFRHHAKDGHRNLGVLGQSNLATVGRRREFVNSRAAEKRVLVSADGADEPARARALSGEDRHRHAAAPAY